MMTRLLTAALLIAATPLRAEDALAPQGTPSTLAALLDGGYQIVSTVPLSAEDQKAIWPNDPVGAYSMLVLQRGASMGACVIATGSVINVAPSALASPNGCRVR